MHLLITNSKEGCPLRRDEVLLIKKLGFEGWKQLKDAGRRWIAEIVFSSIKRVHGRRPVIKGIQCSESRSWIESHALQPVHEFVK